VVDHALDFIVVLGEVIFDESQMRVGRRFSCSKVGKNVDMIESDRG